MPRASARQRPSIVTNTSTALGRWFNSGDEARLRAFAEQHKSPDIVDIRFRQMTGGFDLLSIEKSDRLELRVVVKEKASPKTAVGWFKITDTDPPPKS